VAPGEGIRGNITAIEERQETGQGVDRVATHLHASSGYFEAIGLDVVAGRTFDEARSGRLFEAMVSERFARALGYRPEEIIGRHLRLGTIWFEPTPREIVGVVRDFRMRGPEETFSNLVYLPIVDLRANWLYLVVKSRATAEMILPGVRKAIARIDPELPLYNVMTFDDMRRTYFADRRFTMSMMMTFGVLAFCLAIIGLYSVVAYLVQLRTREIGIRMALGASPARVRAEVMSSGVRYAVAGIVLGVALAVGLFRLASSYVHGLGQIDPASVVVLSAAVAAVAAAATWLPALRATQVDPIAALRAE
jgi:hypothetical protein